MRSWRLCASMLAILGAWAAAASAAPTVRFTASPVQGASCVAPCAVHFDAIGDGNGSQTYDEAYDRPFHSLHFAWQFRDDPSATWPISGLSKNGAIGAIAGHVYETPGEYDVVLRATNPAGEVTTLTAARSVTVADPDQVFASSTWCFANSGTPGGAGFEECPVRTASRHVVIGYQATGFQDALAICGALTTKSRCLFRAGSYFGAQETSRLSDTPGPGLLSRFGTGPNPVVFGSDGFLILRNGWTVAHFDVWLNGGGSGPLFLLSSFNGNVTVLDVTAPIVRNTCFESSISDAPAHSDLVAIVDLECHLQNSLTDATAVYLRAERTLVMGSWIDNGYEGQFNLRTVHFPRSVIQHSRFERPQDDPTDRRNTMQLRSWSGGNAAGTVGPAPSPTEFVIVSDNVLSQDDSDVGIRTCQSNDCVNTPHAMDMRDLIFERNFFRYSTGSGTPPAQLTRGFWLQGGDITVRNNVFDLQGISVAPSQARNRFVWHDPNLASGPSLDDDRIHVLNNTVYYDDPSPNGFQICGGGTSGTGHLCRNNLVYAPRETGPRTESDGSNAWGTTGNLFATALPFASPIPPQGSSDPSDFEIGAASAALDAAWDPRGSGVSVWGDFAARCRPQSGQNPAVGGRWDIGAVERNSSTHCFVTPEPGTALLLGTALAALGARRRARRRTDSVRRIT